MMTRGVNKIEPTIAIILHAGTERFAIPNVVGTVNVVSYNNL